MNLPPHKLLIARARLERDQLLAKWRARGIKPDDQVKLLEGGAENVRRAALGK